MEVLLIGVEFRLANRSQEFKDFEQDYSPVIRSRKGKVLVFLTFHEKNICGFQF